MLHIANSLKPFFSSSSLPSKSRADPVFGHSTFLIFRLRALAGETKQAIGYGREVATATQQNCTQEIDRKGK